MIVRWMRYEIDCEPDSVTATAGGHEVLKANATYTHASPTGRWAKHPRIVLQDVDVKRGHFRLKIYIESGVCGWAVFAESPDWWPVIELERCPACGQILPGVKYLGPQLPRDDKAKKDWQPADPAEWEDVT